MSDDVDPELAAWLTAAREEAAREEAPPEADYGAMLSSVEAQITRAEATPTFWLRTRSTFVRRLIASSAAAIVVVVFGVLLTRRDLAAMSPLHIAVALGALGSLLGLSVHQALRPLHRPPPPRWSSAALTALTLISTLALALFPAGAAHVHGPLDPVSPCLFFGLLTGLPVYAVLRLLDRGKSAAPLLASCAAGLAGNLVLSLHCPSDAPEHLMLGHFSVVLLFVAGLAVVHRLIRPRD
jgi:hypothetical protein